MTDKTKKLIIKILAAVVITVVYSYAACMAGNIVAFISMSFAVFIFDGTDILPWTLTFAPPVLLFTAIDNLLFDPLYKLFENHILVYMVLSGNFMTLYSIFAMIYGFSSSGVGLSFFSYLGAIFFLIPVSSLLGGVLFCFLIRLYKRYKEKNTDGNAL